MSVFEKGQGALKEFGLSTEFFFSGETFSCIKVNEKQRNKNNVSLDVDGEIE